MSTYYCECECGNKWWCVVNVGDLKEYLETVACRACGARPGKGLTVMVAREKVSADYYDALTGRLVRSESWERGHKEYDEAEKMWSSEGSE